VAPGQAGDAADKEDTMMKRTSWMAVLTGALLVGQTNSPKTFATPEQARDALVQAAAKGLDAVKEFFGPESADILRTGDTQEDQSVLKKFNQRAAQKVELEADEIDRNRMTINVGDEEWPFAIPLTRKNGVWFFDVREGKAEIRRRVIGRNELDAIQICRGYVEAQQTYAGTDWDGNGVLQYAKKISSTQGKKDGLYWPGEDSPVAAGFARAAAEGYTQTGGNAYHGYHYKILLAQGPDAEDGARDYVVHGEMIGGFALVAWPAEFGVSGIMTFIVNQDGVVYEKDLGPQTGALAKAMTKFNPDKTWNESPDDEN
jgi:hypothetical protein